MKKLFLFLTLILLLTLHSVGENKSPKILSFEEKFCKVVELLDSKPELEKKTTKRAEKLVKQGKDFLQKRQIKKAKTCFEQAIKESEKIYAKYSGLTILICQQIILPCLRNKQYGLAVKYTDKILDTERELCFPLPAKASLSVLNNAFMVYALAGVNDKFDRCLKVTQAKIAKMNKKEKVQYLPLFYSKLARDYQMINRYSEAAGILKKALNLIPETNYELRYQFLKSLTYSYLESQNYTMSQKIIKDAIKLVNSSKIKDSDYKLRKLQRLQYFSYFEHAKELCKKREYKKALSVLSKACSSLKNIKNQSIYKMLLASTFRHIAEVHAAQGKFYKATLFYKKCFDTYGALFDSDYPGAARTYISLAVNLKIYKEMRKDFLKPKEYLMKALRLAAADEDQILLNEILLKAQEYYCYNHEFPEALKSLRAIGLFIENKNNNKALEYIESVLKNKKNIFNEVALTAVEIYRGIACYELKKYVLALKIFKKLESELIKHPKNIPPTYRPNIFYFIARCEHYLKNYSKAISYYKKLLKEYSKIYLKPYPDLENIYLAIGACYTKIHKLDEASKYLKISITQATDELSRANNLFFYARILSKQKKYNRTIESFDNCLNLALKQKTIPTMLLANAYYEKAKIFSLLGQKTKALKALEGAMKNSFSNKFKDKIDLLTKKIKE